MNLKPLTTRKLHPRASAHMDAIRGAATLAVVAAHTRRLFFVSHQQAWPTLSTLSDLAMTIANESVMVFFVLSGFFISAMVIKAGQRWSWRRYLLDRLTRLHVVLIPALLFTAAIDWVTFHFQYSAPVWREVAQMFGVAPLPEHTSGVIFLGNLAFLQLVSVPAFGSDLPLWSLSSEFWYYMVFPCLFLAVFSAKKMKAIFYVLCVAMFVLLFPHRMVKYFVVWLLGVAVQIAPTTNLTFRHRRTLQISLAALTIAMLFVPLVQRLEVWRLDTLFGAVLSLWIYSLVRIDASDQDEALVTGHFSKYRKAASLLAGFSYSIYVTHFPLLLCVRSFLGGDAWTMTPLHVTIAAGLIVFAVMFSWLFSRLTEVHTQQVRSWLSGVVFFAEPRKASPSNVT